MLQTTENTDALAEAADIYRRLIAGASLEASAPSLASMLNRTVAAGETVVKTIRANSDDQSPEIAARILAELTAFSSEAAAASHAVRHAVDELGLSASVFSSALAARDAAAAADVSVDRLTRAAASQIAAAIAKKGADVRWLARLPVEMLPEVAKEFISAEKIDREGAARLLRVFLETDKSLLPVSRMGVPAVDRGGAVRVGWGADVSAYRVDLLMDAEAIKKAGLPTSISRGVGVKTVERFRFLEPVAPKKVPEVSAHGVGATAPQKASTTFEFVFPDGRAARVAPTIPPAESDKYNEVCEPALLRLLNSAEATRLRELVPRWNDKRFFERVPLKSFLRVATERTRAIVAEMKSPLDHAEVVAAISGDGRAIPAWQFAATDAAFSESERLWQSADSSSKRRAETGGVSIEHLVRGSQVYELAAKFSPIFRARWLRLVPAARFDAAGDRRVFVEAQLADAMSEIEKLLGARRADLIVFREPFALFAAKGSL